MSITIDKEFESLIPPLSPEEFQQLEENCLRDGIRDALIVWEQDGNDILIDGHNRFRIVGKHPTIQFNIKRMQFADRDEARLWIIRNQLGRRNIHDLDRAALLEEEEKIVASKANARMNAGIKADPKEKFPKGKQTRDIMGAKMGVSGKQYEKLKTINKKASPEVKQQIRDGKKSVNGAFNEIKEQERKQIDMSAKAHLEKAEERHKDFAESKTVSIADVAQDRKDSAEIARGKYNEIYNAIKRILFIGASNFDYSIISQKTMGETEIRRLHGEIEIAILTLTRIKNEIGG